MTIRGMFFVATFSVLALVGLASLNPSGAKDERHAQDRNAVASLTVDRN